MVQADPTGAIPRWVGAVAVAVLAAAALAVNIAYVSPTSDVSASHLTLAFVVVACVLPGVLVPVRRSTPMGRAAGRDIRLPGSAVVSVSALPLAVTVGCADGHPLAVAVAVVIATLAIELAAGLVNHARAAAWWRPPVLTLGRLVLLVVMVPLTGAVTARSPALIPIVLVAFLVGHALDVACAAVLRRVQGWPAAAPGSWSGVGWRAFAAAAGTGVLAGAIWVALAGLDPVWAPSLVMAAWLLLVILLMWQRDQAVARAMRVITGTARGLSDLLEAGDMTADAARDAFLLVTARAVGLACSATSVQLVVTDRRTGNVDAGLCLDHCRGSRTDAIPLRAEPPTALRIRLPRDDAWATLSLSCWDGLGSALRLRRHGEAVSYALTEAVRDGRHAMRARDLREGSLADLVDPSTAVISRAALPAAFDLLRAGDDRGSGRGVAVLVARIADPAPTGEPTVLPPRMAAHITRAVLRRLLAAEAAEEVSVHACVTGAGRVVLLVGGGDEDAATRLDRLVLQAAATDPVVVSDDGVTTVKLLVGGALLGRDGHDLGDLLEVADRRSVGEVVTAPPDPWPTLAVALATRAIVTVPAWMFEPGPADHLLAAIEAEADRAPDLLLVPAERPARVAETLVRGMAEAGTRVGLPLGQVSLDHPLRPLAVALVIGADEPPDVLLAAVAIARSANIGIVTCD